MEVKLIEIYLVHKCCAHKNVNAHITDNAHINDKLSSTKSINFLF